jgi:hypothetical protein
MLPSETVAVPASLTTVLAVFSPLFMPPSFRVFCGLARGFLAQPGRRTVCGMLAGTGLSCLWPHDRVAVAAQVIERYASRWAIKATRPDQPTPAEMSALRLAWADAAA